MPKIEIYWDDLTKEKQKEILDKLGDNGNYDVYPISSIEFENKDNLGEKKLFYIKHTETLVGHFAVYAKNPDEAYDKFIKAANEGRVDFGDLCLTDSENEVLESGSFVDHAVVVDDDEDDETEEYRQSM